MSLVFFQSIVYTSTTNKKPTSATSKSIMNRAAGAKTYTTFVPANTKNFYFTVKGVKPSINKFDFVVRVRPLNF